MIFDTSSDKIILISYPSGGFGHFLYHVLANFTNEAISCDESSCIFSEVGDNHSSNQYTNTFFHDTQNYYPTISISPENKIIMVLCDNGINNDGYTTVKKVFPNARIVRLVIDDPIRPVIHQTCTIKASRTTTLFDDISERVESAWENPTEPYAIRECYSLFYHNWSYGWGNNSDTYNVSIELLITDTYNTIVKLYDSLNLTISNPIKLQIQIENWYNANSIYFNVYYESTRIIDGLVNNTSLNISHITDLHTQGYINYMLEKKYNIIIPVYDYKDWFKTTNDMQEMIIECLK